MDPDPKKSTILVPKIQELDHIGARKGGSNPSLVLQDSNSGDGKFSKSYDSGALLVSSQ